MTSSSSAPQTPLGSKQKQRSSRILCSPCSWQNLIFLIHLCLIQTWGTAHVHTKLRWEENSKVFIFLQEFCFSPQKGFELVSVRSHTFYFKNSHTDLPYFSTLQNKANTKPNPEPFLKYRPGKIHLRAFPDWRNTWSLSCFTGLDAKCPVLI